MIYDLLREIARDRTVLVVTHAEELAQRADRVPSRTSATAAAVGTIPSAARGSGP